MAVETAPAPPPTQSAGAGHPPRPRRPGMCGFVQVGLNGFFHEHFRVNVRPKPGNYLFRLQFKHVFHTCSYKYISVDNEAT